jgi:hypothetical protein
MFYVILVYYVVLSRVVLGVQKKWMNLKDASGRIK